MLSSPSPLPSPSLLIEQLRSLEAQVPVCVSFNFNYFSLIGKQPPGPMASPTSSAEHATTANQILAHTRLLCESLAAESTEASRKLSNAVLDVVLYMERLESVGCLLALADTCIGQIRSRMRANSISIHLPSISPSATTLSDSVNGPLVNRPIVSGKLISRHIFLRFLHDNRHAHRCCVIYYIQMTKLCPPRVTIDCI